MPGPLSRTTIVTTATGRSAGAKAGCSAAATLEAEAVDADVIGGPAVEQIPDPAEEYSPEPPE